MQAWALIDGNPLWMLLTGLAVGWITGELRVLRWLVAKMTSSG